MEIIGYVGTLYEKVTIYVNLNGMLAPLYISGLMKILNHQT